MEAIYVSEIICPKCDALADATIDRCSQCGTVMTDDADGKPLSFKEDKTLNKPWVVVVLLLHVGLLGIPVFWKLNYSRTTRLLIVIASILYTIFAVAVIIYFSYWLISMFS